MRDAFAVVPRNDEGKAFANLTSIAVIP
jgi:hypothetical protein